MYRRLIPDPAGGWPKRSFPTRFSTDRWFLTDPAHDRPTGSLPTRPKPDQCAHARPDYRVTGRSGTHPTDTLVADPIQTRPAAHARPDLKRANRRNQCQPLRNRPRGWRPTRLDRPPTNCQAARLPTDRRSYRRSGTQLWVSTRGLRRVGGPVQVACSKGSRQLTDWSAGQPELEGKVSPSKSGVGCIYEGEQMSRAKA